MAHSPEPWKLTMDQILDSTDNLVAAQKGPSGLTKEDMQRIVACVNVLQGVSDETLQRIVTEKLQIAFLHPPAATSATYTSHYIKWTNLPQKGTP